MQKYKNKKNLAVLTCLLLVPIVYGLVGGTADNTKANQSDVYRVDNAAVYLKLFTDFLAENEKRESSEKAWVGAIPRDPFHVPTRPTEKPKKKVTKHTVYRPMVKLGGILWDAVSPTTIINNKVYTVGKKIGKYEIQSIEKDKVILAFSNDVFVVHMQKRRR